MLGAGAGVGRSSEVWRFDLQTCRWDVIQTKGDVPTGRDGHTATYIGNGKFVVFGGQGVPYENDTKSEKITEALKVKTFLIREVFNNLYQFDCEQCVWTTLPIEGAAMPMGRRGHTANLAYINSRFMTIGGSTLPVPHPDHHGHGKAAAAAAAASAAAHADDGFDEKVLLVFGGSGVEPSKYTEILFNDLWAFSFQQGRWMRIVTHGPSPRPLFDHRAELVGDHTLVVIGGITAITPQFRNIATAGGNSIMSDVSVLNLRTMTWSTHAVLDSSGRSASLSLHGHSLASDWVEGGNGNGVIFIFGGKEVVDIRAPTVSDLNLKRSKGNTAKPTCWKLDLHDRCTITPLVTIGDLYPENRYGHVGCSTFGVEQQMHEPAIAPPSASAAGGGAAGGDEHATGGAHRAHSSHHHAWGSTPHRQQRGNNKLSFEKHEDSVMVVYGGSKVNNFGFCDPIVYHLVRIHSFCDPSMTPPAPTNHGSSDALSAQQSSHPGAGRHSLMLEQFGGPSQTSDYSSNRRMSIWEKKKLQMKTEIVVPAQSPTKLKNPENWAELKVALSYSLHEKKAMLPEPVHNKRDRNGSLGAASPGPPSPLPRLAMQSSSLPNLSAPSVPRTGLDGLESRADHRHRIKALSASLMPLFKGRSVHDAKEDYMRMYLVPQLEESGYYNGSLLSAPKKQAASTTSLSFPV